MGMKLPKNTMTASGATSGTPMMISTTAMTTEWMAATMTVPWTYWDSVSHEARPARSKRSRYRPKPPMSQFQIPRPSLSRKNVTKNRKTMDAITSPATVAPVKTVPTTFPRCACSCLSSSSMADCSWELFR